jgi:hypothetical protein
VLRADKFAVLPALNGLRCGGTFWNGWTTSSTRLPWFVLFPSTGPAARCLHLSNMKSVVAVLLYDEWNQLMPGGCRIVRGVEAVASVSGPPHCTPRC